MDETLTLDHFLKFGNGKTSPERFDSGRFPVFGANGIIGYSDSFNTQGPCIILGRVGNFCGSVHLSKTNCWVTDNAISAVPINDESAVFWFEFLKNTNLRSLAHGSGQPLITQKIIKSITAPKFTASEKTGIADVLGSLDDKIAANGEVLDAADRLIRESFRILQKDGQLTLGDICAHDRTTIAPDNFPNTGIYVGLEHFDSPKIWVSRHGSISDVTSTKSAFQNGDTLFSKLRPYFHKVGVAPSGGICSTDILVLRAARSEWRNFVLAAASSDEVVEAAVQNSNGTRMPRAKWTDIAGCAIPDPTTAESRRFIELADGLVPKCIGLMNENETLARTRDELLPLLMSGKISVAGASESGAGAGVEG